MAEPPKQGLRQSYRDLPFIRFTDEQHPLTKIQKMGGEIAVFGRVLAHQLDPDLSSPLNGVTNFWTNLLRGPERVGHHVIDHRRSLLVGGAGLIAKHRSDSLCFSWSSEAIIG